MKTFAISVGLKSGQYLDVVITGLNTHAEVADFIRGTFHSELKYMLISEK